MEVDLIVRVLEALTDRQVKYRVVGGVALNLHGLARATVDLDMFVEPSEDNIARLREALSSVFADPHIDEITAADLSGPYPAIQYVPPEGAFHIDILARLGERFAYDDIESESLEFRGVPVEVATARMLYEMKRDTIRLQDRADAARLRDRFNIEDD